MVVAVGGLGLGSGNRELLLPRNGVTAHAKVGSAHTLVDFTNAFLRACPWFVVTPFDSCTFAVWQLAVCVSSHWFMQELGSTVLWLADE